MSQSHIDIARRSVLMGALQQPEELAAALGLLNSPNRVLEVGVWKGATLWAWAKVAGEAARIVGVDRDLGPCELTEDMLGYRQHLRLIQGNSWSDVTVWAAMEALMGPIDFLFIDASHAYVDVKRDWETYRPLLAPNAVVGFHDIGELGSGGDGGDTLGEARILWDEIGQEYFGNRVEIISRHHERMGLLGIGMLLP